jgi:PAS domain S-box-containing protein
MQLLEDSLTLSEPTSTSTFSEWLDSSSAQQLEDYANLLAEVCQMPMSLLCFLDPVSKNNMSFVFNLSNRAEPGVFCSTVIQAGQMIEIMDARLDPDFSAHPWVQDEPGVRYYCAVPMYGQGGEPLGSLGVLSNRAERLDARKYTQLTRVARMVVGYLELNRTRMQTTTAKIALDALLEKVPSGVVTCDALGNLDLFNQTARLWHGTDPRSLPPEAWASSFDLYEEDGHTLLTTERIPLRRAFAGEVVENQEMVIKAKNQRPRHVLCSGRKLKGVRSQRVGAIVVMHDITELKRAQKDLRRVGSHLKAVIDASQDVAIISTDKAGRIQLFNTGAERLLGYREQDIQTSTPLKFHLEEEVVQRGRELTAMAGRPVEGFDVFVYAASQGEPETRTWTYVRADSSHVKVRLSVSTVKDERLGVVGFLGVAVPI